MPRVLIVNSSDSNSSEQSYEVNENKSLYQEMLQHGIDLPHGCLSGSCGACRIEVIEGSENLSSISFVEQNTIDSIKEEHSQSSPIKEDLTHKDIRLACRAKVHGPIKIKNL